MSDAELVLENVSLARAGRQLLDCVSLSLPDRGVTAIIGPNGAGKSLCLRVMAGLVTPDRGRVTGSPGGIGLVFQQPVLLRRTVYGNLRHTLRALSRPRAQVDAEIARLLDMAGLSGLARMPARRLSGGEQQRLALIRALAARPGVLLLDEPTASLDPQSTAAIEDLVRQAVAAGTQAVLVTHDIGQARRLASDVVFLQAGRVAEHTAAEVFFGGPTSDAAADYLAGRLNLEESR